MTGNARLAGMMNMLRQSSPAISGLISGMATGGGIPGGLLTAGLTQGGNELGSRMFAKHLAGNEMVGKLADRSNTNRQIRYDAMPAPTPLQMEAPGYTPRAAFAPQTHEEFAGEMGGYVGGGLGALAGLGGTAILGSIFAPDEPEVVYAQPPISPAAPNPVQQQQAMQQGQSPPQGQIVLNAEQVKKAQQRALEQAALNQYYAEQLTQYPVQ
jgi:hypothetical protein